MQIFPFPFPFFARKIHLRFCFLYVLGNNKKYSQKLSQNGHLLVAIFLQVSQVCKMETFAFLAITFEPIGILTHSAHQNDRLNLNFVKDKHTVSQKMARNGSKVAIYFLIFISKQSLF